MGLDLRLVFVVDYVCVCCSFGFLSVCLAVRWLVWLLVWVSCLVLCCAGLCCFGLICVYCCCRLLGLTLRIACGLLFNSVVVYVLLLLELTFVSVNCDGFTGYGL